MAKRNNSGFTIIEVALVLAIAGLIFLVVFLAVPALQRNQRDDARKRDVSNVVESVTNYVANSNKIPDAGDVWPAPATGTAPPLTAYISNLSGNVDYVSVVATLPTAAFSTSQVTTAATAAGTAPRVNQVIVYTKAQCDGNTGVKAGSTRMAAVVVQIEAGGAGKYYCQDAS
jgi:prepilin-type N-terminal cleavage/methylation domain-containing protein